MYCRKKEINTILIIVFLFNVIFLPNDTFFLKKASFALLILLNLSSFRPINNKDGIFFLFFGALFPIATILKSILLMGDPVGNFMEGFSGFMFLIYFVIKRYEIDFETILMKVLMMLAWFMVVMALLDYAHILPTRSNPLLMWFHDSANAMIGKGENHAFGIIYFMKASPLLLIALPYQIRRNKIVSVLVVFYALILSGTRANVLLAVMVLFSCYIYKDKNPKRRMLLILGEAVAVIVIVIGTGIIQKVVNAFVMKADGDTVRNLTLKSILDVWRDEPIKFWLGSGYNSQFYNAGRGEYLNTVELSYWNVIRRLGIFSFLLLMFMFFKPLKMIRTQTCECMGFIAFLTVAYVDPVLYSSTGITAVLYMYWLYYLKDRKDEPEEPVNLPAYPEETQMSGAV